MKKLLTFTSLLELTLGVALIIFPSIVLSLLIGFSITNDIGVVGRLAGIVYVCFGLACYPTKHNAPYNNQSMVVWAMFAYNFLAAIYLGYMKFGLGYSGELLFPAFVLHTIITLCFIFLMKRKE